MSSKIQKITLAISILLMGFWAVAQAPSTVSVTLLNNTFKHVDLVNAYGNGRTVYSSADIKDNAFKMNLKVDNDIYRFDFGNENYFLMCNKQRLEWRCEDSNQ